MCGFAGIVDLTGLRKIDRSVVERMANAIRHRGPDDNGWFSEEGVGIAHRRLSIVGVETGHQPIFNEDRTVAVIFNGELFDYPEQRAWLITKGHQLRTTTDTEIIVHLYEEYGEKFFEHLKGQFAFALYDHKQRKLILGRDRFGICPLHWCYQDKKIYFGSEIKALLASGEITPKFDPKGLDHIFTFFAIGRRRTMFMGIQSLLPGHYLRFELGGEGRVSEFEYWDLNFPDQGEEEDPLNEEALLDEFQSTFQEAVKVRLRADVPVVGYLSGGIDSAAVVAQATSITGTKIPTFTIKISGQNLDESDKAMITARHLGTRPTIIEAGPDLISRMYPKLVSASDSPVVDTSCAALYALAKSVHNAGYKVVLTGEGSDEALAGYVWFKMQKVKDSLNIGTLRLGNIYTKVVQKLLMPSLPLKELSRRDELTGGTQAQTLIWHLMSLSRNRFYSKDLFHHLKGSSAYDDLELDTSRMKRWHPLNQSLYLGYKVLLAGLLLNHKGDRIAMGNSVETRYPFLDENMVKLMSRLHPRWKLRGLKDKYLLRKTASRWLPEEIALRPKGMFRAPFGESFVGMNQSYVNQLLSEEALNKTNYFDVKSVRSFYQKIKEHPFRNIYHFSSMGLAAVISTQLWHHQNFGGGLCDLPYRDFSSKEDLEKSNLIS
ncbi:MAG: asparagine synthase (glutamine-hydrolyzing) [Hyphomicrobium sp.]